MNLEEAQRVLWLKSNPRPLGELMDEGYLTTERLEWAAQWAYNPKLKEAAKLILETIYHTSVTRSIEKPQASDAKVEAAEIEIGISLEQARSIIWPFAPYKGQSMGTLVDSKQLSLKDLAYAAESAWDPKVRHAAVALSLIRLNQVVKEPVPSAGFVHVISGGRNYSERRQLSLTMRQGIILGLLISLVIALLLRIISHMVSPSTTASSITEIASSPAVVIVIIAVIASMIFIGWLIGFAFEKIMEKLDKQIEEHRRGQDGEEKVVQLILQALDGNWRLFRNINLPGINKGDLDLVLVGPPGVWALEVKNFHGKYRNIGEHWEYRNGKAWKAASTNPSRQVLNNAYRLKNFLKADHLNVFVETAVVWANQDSHLSVENPSVAIWHYDRLPDELGNIWQGEKLSQEERNKIVDKLTKLCLKHRNPH